MTESLSLQQARKLVLHAQLLPPTAARGSAIDASLAAIEQLAYLQIDTISVIQRAHHHTLWNRNPRYQVEHLDRLVKDKKVFEYWSHAAAYLPMRDYRFSLPRKHAFASGQQKHWYNKNTQLMDAILKRISEEGPLMAKDFEHHGKKTGDWASKPAKQALECLFMQGDLMVPYRQNFHKVYQLTERVLPTTINTSVPCQEEHSRFLVTSYLRANGLGQASEMVYLLKNNKKAVENTLNEMLNSGEVDRFNVNGHPYFALPASLPLLSKPLARSKLKILSPFDNLLIQRKRMQKLFDFDYLIECYVPKAKRQYGYFSLPILWDGRLVARMDCKAERSSQTLHIFNLVLEPWLKKLDAFSLALTTELAMFMRFNQCNALQLSISKANAKQLNTTLLSQLTAFSTIQ
ncbi:winged helix-turn-helix domain-containing protein [Agarivorans sp. 1_MG-2023]|uniref:winged helix-turn-helix domain-containing protein n=1 Tax=Agarivorans sp. 1_MG-2023 TaxID=3062634 RepID=UPI0026E16CA7|nr:crosslink repair DNA glycosylase YcaQ family protein [Agarivorans sp. 1_MG-2023]MDO6764296.1 crosslink repair DNA glycosylase YcaQ family protein [Agarivorans sp. 1_MG-2023]